MHISTVCMAALALFSSAVSASPSPAGGLRQSTLANRSDSSHLSRRSPSDSTFFITPFYGDPPLGYVPLALTSNGQNNVVTLEIFHSPPSDLQKWDLLTDTGSLQMVLPFNDIALQAAWENDAVELIFSTKASLWDIEGPDDSFMYTIFSSDHSAVWSSSSEAHTTVTLAAPSDNNQKWMFAKAN